MPRCSVRSVLRFQSLSDTCRFDPLDSKLLQVDHWRLPVADPAQWLWEKKHIMIFYHTMISHVISSIFFKSALQSKDMICLPSRWKTALRAWLLNLWRVQDGKVEFTTPSGQVRCVLQHIPNTSRSQALHGLAGSLCKLDFLGQEHLRAS